MDSWPKIDTHRHLGGSIPTDFVWEIVRELGLSYLAESEQEVRQQMTFAEDEPRQFHRFLDKFRILDEIPWTEDLIDRSIRAVCAELAEEQIDYALLDFSINKYMRLGWHKHEAIKFIYGAFARHRPNGVGLILSIKYESMRASQRQYAKLLTDDRVYDCLLGIDLVGDELEFDPTFHGPILSEWRDAGKLARAHVGECGPQEHVAAAIVNGATNIAHGLSAISDREMLSRLAAGDISVDLGITSNLLTGVATLDNHPLRPMLDAGLRLTIGTDDPVICKTTLDQEYKLCRTLGASEQELTQMRANAVHMVLRFEPFLHALLRDPFLRRV